MATFDPWHQLKLLELAELDAKLTKAQYRLERLPLLATVAEVDEKVKALRHDEVAYITLLADLELDISKAEEDVDVVRKRVSKDQELLNSGAISDSKQLSELQHEVGSLGRRQSDLEDAEMELLQKQEELNAKLSDIRSKQTEVAAELSTLQDELAAQEHEIRAEMEVLETSRGDLLPNIEPELVNLYERIRRDNDGVGAALLQQRKCTGCGMQLAPTAVSAARVASSDQLIRCEECKAILVRTDESGL